LSRTRHADGHWPLRFGVASAARIRQAESRPPKSFVQLTDRVTTTAMIPAAKEVRSMAKYYVRSGWVRLVLDARTPGEAAVKAILWSRDRRAEIFAEPAGERLREAEALEWQLDDQITVNQTGFTGGAGDVFDTAVVGVLSRRRVNHAAGPIRGRSRPSNQRKSPSLGRPDRGRGRS
jgi:hypothetical protein